MLAMLAQEDNCSVAAFRGRVRRITKTEHIKGLVKNIETIEAYVVTDDIFKCAKFVEYATSQDTLNANQKSEYEETVLHQHRLTILDYRDTSSFIEMLEDQDDNELKASVSELQTSLDPETSASEPQPSLDPVLKWNVPCTGEIFIDIVRNFIKTSAIDDLKLKCDRVPAFAGYWYQESIIKERVSNSSMLYQK